MCTEDRNQVRCMSGVVLQCSRSRGCYVGDKPLVHRGQRSGKMRVLGVYGYSVRKGETPNRVRVPGKMPVIGENVISVLKRR